MPTYITLGNFTDQGIRNVKETTKRAAAFKQAAVQMGISIKAFYYTIGRYDLVVIGEAPDAETFSALALATGSLGNVRTESLMAFSIEEMANITAKMP